MATRWKTIATAISIETIKARRATIGPVSVLAALIFPLLIGLVMSDAIGVDSPVTAEIEQTPAAYLMQFELVVAIGGLIGFGFLFSWLFGREFSDGTVTDLLALPISRIHIVGSKFIVGAGWSSGLSLLLFAVGTVFTRLVLKDPATWSAASAVFGQFALTVAMTIFLSMAPAFVASVGRGYLAPLGFVIMMVVAAQILSVVGAGPYFPWAVPGLYSGVAGESAMQLATVSLVLPFLIGGLAMAATVLWWRYADQT